MGLTPDAQEEGDSPVEIYWQTVDQNLRAGRLRLLFVADRLPQELRAIIEFLHEKMDSVEVLGVELRQYAADGLRALVPRLIGQTEATRATKGTTSKGAPTPKLTEATFLEGCEPQFRDFFADVIRDSVAKGMTIYWGGTGFSLRSKVDGQLQSFYYGFLPNAMRSEEQTVQVYLKWVGDEARRQEVRDRILKLGGFKASGEYTADLKLHDRSSAESARRALEIVWGVVAGL